MASDSSQFFHYTPSIVAAAVFAALFAITTLHHTYQFIRARSWFMIPLLLGCVCEVAGFVARVISANESPDYKLGPYIMQAVLLLVPPVLFAASIYMMFGYIILVLDADHYSLIREKWLTKIFVLGDIIAFLTQGTGASMTAKDDADSQKAGKYIIVGGLVLQLIFFGFFIFCAVLFHTRIHRRPTQRSSYDGIHWRIHIWILYIASLLIMVRSVFRVVEYLQGTDGYILSKEWFMYVFDSALMLLTVVIFNLKHPSAMRNILTGRHAVGLIRSKDVIKLDELDSDKHGFASATNQSGSLMSYLPAEQRV